MADTKTSDLTALTGVNVDTAADVIPIVDTSVTTLKKITVEELRVAVRPVLGTVATTTSGTEHDFTVPAGTRQITITFSGVSSNGTSNPLIQLGDSGGIETSGYLGVGSNTTNAAATVATNFTTGFGIVSAGASNVLHGSITLTLLSSSAFTWSAIGTLGLSNAAAALQTVGSKSLSAELTTVRLTTTNGSDTFDAGSVNVLYE